MNLNCFSYGKRISARCWQFGQFSSDLVTSLWITLLIYFIAVVTIYSRIYRHQLTDPSQVINTQVDYCSNYSSFPVSRADPNDVIIVTRLVTRALQKANYKYFLCYRSLYELIEFNEIKKQDRLDICIYEDESDFLTSIHYAFHSIGLSSLTRQLKEPNLLKYEYDPWLGYFKVNYHSASVYLYIFKKAAADRMNFQGVRRAGIVYTQFEYVIETMKNVYGLSGQTGFSPRTELPKISLLNRLPIYMIENRVEFRIRIGEQYVALPDDPHVALMFSYPSFWWQNVCQTN